MRWETHESIDALPRGLWERQVARGKCATSPAFLAALERTFPDQEHVYFVAYEGAVVVGCAMLNVVRHDLSLEMPAFLRKLVAGVRKVWPSFCTLRLAMTGTLETYGDHHWFDSERVSLAQFVGELRAQMRSYERMAHVLVFRDFIVTPEGAERLETARQVFAGHRFGMGGVLPVAQLPIAAFSTPEEYLKSLKSRDRYTIRKANKKARQAGIRLEFVSDYEHLLDECYPLYLAVNERATELVTEPLPRRFFSEVGAQFGPAARLLTARDADGVLVGFALVLESEETMEVFAVGLDYERLGRDFSMYNLLWECIAEAVRNGRRRVDLGVTNYFIKERFGAQILPMKVFFKASNPVLGLALRSAFDIEAGQAEAA